jgi:hypothetical protein
MLGSLTAPAPLDTVLPAAAPTWWDVEALREQQNAGKLLPAISKALPHASTHPL